MLRENPLYSLWISIRQRCYSPSDKEYRLYGARGIRMCRSWRRGRAGFRHFMLDVGPRPPGAILARKDKRGHYEPANVQWSTRAAQNRNGGWCKLTRDQAQEVLGRLEHGEGPSSIARRMGVTAAHVSMIRLGRAWGDLGPVQRPPTA